MLKVYENLTIIGKINEGNQLSCQKCQKKMHYKAKEHLILAYTHLATHFESVVIIAISGRNQAQLILHLSLSLSLS